MNEVEVREFVKKVMSEYENNCSIDIGNSKTGQMKVYFNPEEPEKAKQRLDFALKMLLEYRKQILE